MRLRQILINLVGHAFKFTDQGEVVLRVQVHPPVAVGEPANREEKEITLKISLRDSGIGIPKDKQNTIV